MLSQCLVSKNLPGHLTTSKFSKLFELNYTLIFLSFKEISVILNLAFLMDFILKCVILQGHMYLFLHHICFYSNIFGYETKKTIPLQEVTDVRKAKTAAIFSNAIEIVAGSRRHFFGSFLSRDEAYQIIVDGWEQHVSNARLLLERQETKSASSSEENGYVLLEGAKEPKQDEDSSPLDRSVNSTAVSSGSADGGDSNINISRRFSNVEENGLEDNIITLNPFNLEPVDDTPSGLWLSLLFLFIFISLIVC
ncbi:Protein VASCULAR ASSOCIATED DEATH 1 chloroplastic [Zea mays]|uniref:Protein VASCULAR ASSOCIATED DEATH 1 chloroplastic n=1 Tax=Zea mays TaxID=4577 RepID=A0A1D6EW00_MAIZE|nr:Protein VASCULAR ASSOCIATED DEATH 1 chloroplastic [Zea mays]